MGTIRCNNKWKQDHKFIKYKFRVDEEGRRFIPFCVHPSHIGLISDDQYRQKKCEKNGGGKPCVYYRRLREESAERVFYRETNSIEVTIHSGQD